MENWFKIEFIFTKNLNIDPLVLDQLEFYRIEYMIQNYEEFIEEENKRHEKQEKESNAQISKQKLPNQGQFKMPTYKPPDVKMPKL